jgi:putrescine aminotransferase
MITGDIIADSQKYLMNTYARQPIVLIKGRGMKVFDSDGREYYDYVAGVATNNLGHCHPRVVVALQKQAQRLMHISNHYHNEPQINLAKMLVKHSFADKAFFCNSGTEAIEGAIKLAKMYTRKNGFIAALKAFHGKTMGSLSLLGKADFRQPVGTLYGGPVYHVPFGDADAVERQLDTCKQVGIDIAAVLMEPIQGEAGAIVPPDDFWPRLREMTRRYGVLLIADEVQTGLGRTGKLWGVDHWNVEPDIIAVAKSLGGGVMPICAFCSTEEIWQVMMYPNPFIHTNTTGGGALACSAAIAAINVTLRDRLWEQAAVKGDYFISKLKAIAAQYPQIYESTLAPHVTPGQSTPLGNPRGMGQSAGVTGRGLLIGMHFKDAAVGYKVAAGLFKRGVLVAGTLTSAHTVRIEPPLIITFEQIDAVLNRLSDTLTDVSQMS